jgi:hypothetical protein
VTTVKKLPHIPTTPPQHRRPPTRGRCAGYVVPGTPCLLLPVTVDELHGLPLCAEHAPACPAPSELFRLCHERLRSTPPIAMESPYGNLMLSAVPGGLTIWFYPDQESGMLLWWDSRQDPLTAQVCAVLDEARQCLV